MTASTTRSAWHHSRWATADQYWSFPPLRVFLHNGDLKFSGRNDGLETKSVMYLTWTPARPANREGAYQTPRLILSIPLPSLETSKSEYQLFGSL